MTACNKSQYIFDVKVMNYLLQSIPNDIYNLVDACKNAKEMWERIKRLMFGSDVTSHVRHLRLMDEFDKFAAKEGESLEYVYEGLTMLVNIMDHNNVRPIPVSINTKYLNSSKAKKVAKNHDPLALLVHSNAFHHNLMQILLVTHPSLIVDYEDEYQGELQGDSQEDKLTTAMMLLTRAITQKFSTPTNNRLCTSSNIRNQAVIQDGRVDIQTKNEGYGGNVMLMARIQPADGNTETVPSYDAKAVSEVNASSKVHEKVSHVKCKTIIQTSDDDQIDSNIIFDDPYVENNGGMSDHDSNAHDEYHEIQRLAYNVQKEAENKKMIKQ
ncbi:hypothetical protein Tco_0401500 [Tanacetum coccineum]